MPFSRILVAFDGSESSRKALRKGIQLAGTNPGAEISVLYVSRSPKVWFPQMPADPAWENDEAQIKALLDDAENRWLKGIPNKWRTLVSEGRPAEQILAYAAEHRCDLVIMGNRGRSGLAELLLGSVSHAVVQHSPVPVLVMK